MDRKFVMTAFGYAVLGLALGLYMGASKDHSQLVTHAHIMLVGFVMSFVYAVCHKLWLEQVSSRLVQAQFYMHQGGAVLMFAGLFLMYGGYVEDSAAGPLLGLGSALVLAGAIVMKVLFIRATKV